MNDTKHVFFMQKALLQARLALKKNEVPVGAVIVDSKGIIISRGYNKIEILGCQTAHAEVLAIQKACKRINDWRLDGCWIYVTLEPCLMCFGLIQLSRLKGVIFGANCEQFGSKLAKEDSYQSFYKKDLIVRGGLKENECADILKGFFKKIRKKRKDGYESKGRFS